MSALLITSNLPVNGPRFIALRHVIDTNFPGGWQCLQSVFVVSTLATPVEVRELIKPVLRDEDELLVAELAKSGWAWRGMSRAGFDWLRAHA